MNLDYLTIAHDIWMTIGLIIIFIIIPISLLYGAITLIEKWIWFGWWKLSGEKKSWYKIENKKEIIKIN